MVKLRALFGLCRPVCAKTEESLEVGEKYPRL